MRRVSACLGTAAAALFAVAPTAAALVNPAGAKIDGVAFSPGVTQAVEGTPLRPQPAALDFLAPAYGRNILSTDTNNNAFDFTLLVHSPGQPN